MRSRVCKKAHELIKDGESRSLAFRAAWASELKLGKVINIEYGNYGNHVECTIVSIKLDYLTNARSLGKYFHVHAISNTGQNIDFVEKPRNLIKL